MTPEETREAAQLMLDWADQQFDVQSQPHHWADGWACTKDPQWNWSEHRYRRKPTPTLRPYTAEECVGLVGEVVKRKAASWLSFVVDSVVAREIDASSDRYIDIRITLRPLDDGVHHNEYVSPVGLLGYRRDDGSPCGVEV